MMQYKENQNVSNTMPVWLNMAYSIGWSGVETEMYIFKLGANFRNCLMRQNLDKNLQN
jgi:hypothetical protein